MKTYRKDGSAVGSPTTIVREEPDVLVTCADWLDALKSKLALESDYQLAAKFKLSRSRVSNWRTGKNGFDEGIGLIIERELGLLPGTVMSWQKAAQSKDANARDYWSKVEDLLRRASGAAAAVLLGIGLVSAPSAQANQVDSKQAPEYTLSAY